MQPLQHHHEPGRDRGAVPRRQSLRGQPCADAGRPSQEMIFRRALVAARTYLQDTSRYIALLEARLRAYRHNLEDLLLTKRD